MEERYTDGKPGARVYIGFIRLDASALPIYPLPMLALPINPALFAAFKLAASVVAISPGPDTIMILRHALNAGLRTGLISVAGVQAGLGVHTTLAALGLSVVIASSPLLFQAIAGAGAIYLGWLGIQGFPAPLLAAARLFLQSP